MSDNPQNRKALLVVSFGTSYEETRKKTIDVIEAELLAAFADRHFYRAWTSKIIRKKLKETSGIDIDGLDEAWNRMRFDGVRDVLIVPTVLTDGREYRKILDSMEAHGSDVDGITVSKPLLFCREDILIFAKTLEEIFGDIDSGDLVAFMGHGSAFDRLRVYEQLDECLKRDGYSHFCVGTAEYEPGFAPVLCCIRQSKPGRVFLSPLMVVAGDHAMGDLAGAGENSWKSQIRHAGFQTECILKGLGEYPQIRELYVRHAREAEVRKSHRDAI